jgi:hypothetical protein
MTCFTCENNLSAYIDDELNTDVRREIETHLDTCEKCRSEYETHMATWENAGNMRTEAAPDDLWKTIETDLKQQTTHTSTEDLALMVRGLASDIRDLKQTVDQLRRDIEFRDRKNIDPSDLGPLVLHGRRRQMG